ncbi:inositol monophosphatase [Aeromicrobium sp. PE09-221]|uniref:inositol monophosphatase family protein n=1 Tax=Aeromicrobium sp. PE09-221 TaxID=1898043 RepID=UPI000B3E550B|nr:inositol monophosphatase [Aeromicrobium sp. PE09-221]OUZ11011.1 inositol monophosphatase [Aeromicrobium sp. PE09-221]
MTDDARLAASLVSEAAGLAARMRSESDLRIMQKTSISDIVTSADTAAERHMVETLAGARPEDGILGEEGAAAEGTSGRRWIIDPVDGTYNFASGSDYWCSAIALVDGDELVLGAVAHASTGDVYVGGPKRPTTVNGLPAGPIPDLPLAGISAATYLHPPRLREPEIADAFMRAASLPATLRMLGSGSMDLVGVATGLLGCWFQHSVPTWDWLPGAALVAGVGGATRQFDVGPVTWSVAGPPTAVDEVVAALDSQA